MGVLFDSYCHPDIQAAVSDVVSGMVLPNGFELTGYTITDDDSVVFTGPSGSYSWTFPACDAVGYRSFVGASFEDVSLLLGACAVVVVIAWGFKMGKGAIS